MTYVKICGCRTVAEALAARDAGADFIGLVFAESRRRVPVDVARLITEALRPDAATAPPAANSGDGLAYLERLLSTKRPLLVGVFEGQSTDEVESTAALTGIDVVQLHGGMADGLSTRLPLIQAVDPEAQDVAVDRSKSTICLLDGSRGHGRRGDWASLTSIASRAPFILAGGLTPENVVEAVRRLRPWGVDVSSGVETAGRKDAAKMCAFVVAAKGAISDDFPSR